MSLYGRRTQQPNFRLRKGEHRPTREETIARLERGLEEFKAGHCGFTLTNSWVVEEIKRREQLLEKAKKEEA